MASSTEMENRKTKNMKKKNNNRRSYSFFPFPKFNCISSDDDDVVTISEKKPDQVQLPTHLIVMVNGIIGSSKNWRYAAKQLVKAYPNHVLVHCSESNSSMLTFEGVDVAGKRLADEVISVAHRHPNLRKISFVGHSLGGLVARYAIAVLYQKYLERTSGVENCECDGEESKKSLLEEKTRVELAGLEPANFITSATPHLGSRGHKQVPVFCGFHTMEKVASHASWLLGRSGKHLFLADNEDGKPPLLLQMSNDTEDLKFISALQSFKRRVAYANARFDHLVGWSSSSLRRRNELPKRRNLVKNDKYRHIVSEATSDNLKPFVEDKFGRSRNSKMEEEMIRGLTRMSWERVDVNFSGTIQRLFSHNTIQVKTYCINYDGADVIQHMVDNFEL